MRKLYPLHVVKQSVSKAFERSRYFRVARHYGIDYYPETEMSRLYRDVCAVDLLRRVQADAPWLPSGLFPGGGGAADHKLLYVLSRALGEFRFRSILECGAGETTKLLDAFAKESGHQVTTLEHDDNWATRAGQNGLAATHSVLHCPLVSYEDSFVGRYLWYDTERAAAKMPECWDLFVVDGPTGTRRFSRFGISRIFPARADSDWLLLWDDLDRTGDLESFGLLMSRLRSSGASFGHRLILSRRTLGIAFTPRFSQVSYYL
jgi:hypothetical protein